VASVASVAASLAFSQEVKTAAEARSVMMYLSFIVFICLVVDC
jgi:hypothetical protein